MGNKLAFLFQNKHFNKSDQEEAEEKIRLDQTSAFVCWETIFRRLRVSKLTYIED